MHVTPEMLTLFVTESNKIEGILRAPHYEELCAHQALLEITERPLDVTDIERLVGVLQPGARLRVEPGMDVRVGNHIAPPGGHVILARLGGILNRLNDATFSAYDLHHEYETLHPFMDGNGRSGRALWLYQMINQAGSAAPLTMGFLHLWYYQSLGAGR